MSYRIKSLVYFICFLASTITYYAIGNDIQTTNDNGNKEIAELQMEPMSFELHKTLK